ncbi:mitochondrial import inner membrane translocase subunit TIM44-2 [Apium graveolens]|uniref:mitochondrial import inner membrane translocase subunit TIM44-2 n=1 Tax=Apium graveolens TaxID=4045 RepID=UPI003D79E748
MAYTKLVRVFLLTKQPLFRQLLAPQVSIPRTRLRLQTPDCYMGVRQLSFFDKFKEEVNKNPELDQSVKELKKKAEEFRGATENLKVRTKQTTEQLYKHVDGVWKEAEATTKKVSSNLKEKVSAATEEVKESFGMGKQESSGTNPDFNSGVNDGSKSANGEGQQKSGHTDAAQTLYSKFKSGIAYISPNLSSAYQKVKDTKLVDLAKKGCDIVKEELKGTPTRKRRLEYTAPEVDPFANIERSTRTDIVILPTKQSRWSKKWEAIKEKLRGNPVFKRVGGLSEPVVTKTQELAEDVREMWEVSDNPVVHKIQDINESVFGETAAGISVKEIRRRDPSFSLPEFRDEVQEVVRPILNAYYKGDVKFLKKYCIPEVIERCSAEHKAFASQNIVVDNKILHVSDVDVRETKMMGETPVIIVQFQTQEVYCIRDKVGSVAEGGQDMILTVQYGWAMQRMDDEEIEGGSPFPIWKLREMQKSGFQALI